MEHRMSRRVQVRAPVRIIFRGREFGQGEITEISYEGAFIEIKNSVKLPENSSLSLSLFPVTDSTQEPVHVTAMVIHHSSRGVGIMFSGANDELNQFVSFIVDHCQIKEPARDAGISERGKASLLETAQD